MYAVRRRKKTSLETNKINHCQYIKCYVKIYNIDFNTNPKLINIARTSKNFVTDNKVIGKLGTTRKIFNYLGMYSTNFSPNTKRVFRQDLENKKDGKKRRT